MIFWKPRCVLLILLTVASVLTLGSSSDAASTGFSGADLEAIVGKSASSKEFRDFLEKLPKISRENSADEPFYILEGDLRLTARQVWAHLNLVDENATAKDGEIKVSPNSELNVMFRNGKADRWPVGKRALTYAIDRKSFASEEDYELVMKNFRIAMNSWTKNCPCGLSFSHLSKYDANPSLKFVTFIVKYDPDASDYYAAAFFPNDPVDTRYVYIGAPYFFDETEYDRIGILRHEGGHILGYRHGHLGKIKGCEFYNRDENDKEWRSIGNYDRRSVMHYLCGGGGTKSFELSAQDVADHKKFYMEGIDVKN